MVLKRKRSDSDMSASSMLSSPPNFKFMDMDSSPFNAQSMRDTHSPHLSGRTRKRYRDNRPSEETIHQNTLSMMYSAQRQDPSPIVSRDMHSPAVAPQPQPMQSSLHAFWSIPSQPSPCASSNASPSPAHAVQACQAANCEDCNAPFAASGEGPDVEMMDIDVYANGMDYGCTGCGKQVCGQCSVSNMGAQRQCLICAGKRRWVGGLGWVDN